MNYHIITDTKIAENFIDNFLPELEDNETFYLCLFARSKYAKNEDGTNKFPHIKTDRAQLKRFTVSKKKNMMDKIRQLEVAVGAYRTKDGEPIPQESLALYINPNPRNQKKAMCVLIKNLMDIQINQGKNFNLHAEALSAIQQSASRKIWIDFDIDGELGEQQVFMDIYNKYLKPTLPEYACNILKTRGGIHFLVKPDLIPKEFSHSWYMMIVEILKPDIKGDNMIPFPGTHQGGFTPHFINHYETL